MSDSLSPQKVNGNVFIFIHEILGGFIHEISFVLLILCLPIIAQSRTTIRRNLSSVISIGVTRIRPRGILSAFNWIINRHAARNFLLGCNLFFLHRASRCHMCFRSGDFMHSLPSWRRWERRDMGIPQSLLHFHRMTSQFLQRVVALITDVVVDARHARAPNEIVYRIEQKQAPYVCTHVWANKVIVGFLKGIKTSSWLASDGQQSRCLHSPSSIKCVHSRAFYQWIVIVHAHIRRRRANR